VLSYVVRALDSLPVYRQQDQGSDVTKNRETFVAARRLLSRGGTIGICPEGVSHDEPRLRPIKTGAARIALAAVSTGEVKDLKIVPAGLYYTSKTTFRSSALLHFGKPLEVTAIQLDPNGEPPRVAVRELSDRIQAALREVMLDAQHDEALTTIARAERIFSSHTENIETLADELQMQQRFARGYLVLQERAPERLRKLEVRMSRFEEELKQARVDAEELSPPVSTIRVFSTVGKRTLLFLLMLPAALLGTVVHYPAYATGGYLARTFSGDSEDVISTTKIISAMLLFPLTWIAIAVAAYQYGGWLVGALPLLLLPPMGYVAIKFFEELDESVGGLRVLTFFLTRRRFFVRLLAERNAIHDEIVALGNEVVSQTE
jgi:hypothetical protein